MSMAPKEILTILDRCCDEFRFPMLDNGYIYPAATRLSLYRSAADWAIAIEVFGYSPRFGLPDTTIHTFASRIHNRNRPEDYINRDAYERYLVNNPHNDSHQALPVEEGPWQDAECDEYVAEDAREVVVRGQAIELPPADAYEHFGIELEEPPRVRVFELCRFLAHTARELVLATPQELRFHVMPELEHIMQLEEWHHPNVVDDDDRPSGSETFQQLARVLVTGDIRLYQPSREPNTHWRNWPEGGTL